MQLRLQVSNKPGHCPQCGAPLGKHPMLPMQWCARCQIGHFLPEEVP